MFDAAQNFLNDVSLYATGGAGPGAEDPKPGNVEDIAKSPISAEDNKAIAAPDFEWHAEMDPRGRDPVETDDVATAGVWCGQTPSWNPWKIT